MREKERQDDSGFRLFRSGEKKGNEISVKGGR